MVLTNSLGLDGELARGDLVVMFQFRKIAVQPEARPSPATTMTIIAEDSPQRKALYVTLMDMKQADCDQPLATINVMNSIARVFGYGHV